MKPSISLTSGADDQENESARRARPVVAPHPRPTSREHARVGSRAVRVHDRDPTRLSAWKFPCRLATTGGTWGKAISSAPPRPRAGPDPSNRVRWRPFVRHRASARRGAPRGCCTSRSSRTSGHWLRAAWVECSACARAPSFSTHGRRKRHGIIFNESLNLTRAARFLTRRTVDERHPMPNVSHHERARTQPRGAGGWQRAREGSRSRGGRRRADFDHAPPLD